jgi:hypothetical protein
MIKSIKFLSTLITIVFLSSFASKNSTEFIGTYGVSASDPSQIKLIIHADNTFYYQDLSNPNKKLIINGSWVSKGKKVFLKDSNSSKRFHHVWTISAQGNVAKSRNGLTFYRLCKIDG